MWIHNMQSWNNNFYNYDIEVMKKTIHPYFKIDFIFYVKIESVKPFILARWLERSSFTGYFYSRIIFHY